MGSAPSSHVTWQGTQGAKRQLLTSSQLFPSSVKEGGGGMLTGTCTNGRRRQQTQILVWGESTPVGSRSVKTPAGGLVSREPQHLSQYSRIARSCRSSRSWRSRRPPG